MGKINNEEFVILFKKIVIRSFQNTVYKVCNVSILVAKYN